MRPEEIGGSIEFRFGVPLVPWRDNPENYITEVEGDIAISADSDDDEPDEKVGTIKLFVVKLAQALRNGVELTFILDCRAIESLYRKLFERDGAFRTALSIEAPYGDLLVIEEIELDPRFDDAAFRDQVIETAIATFASVSIVVLPKRLIPAQNLQDRGYVGLRGTDYAVRDNYRMLG